MTTTRATSKLEEQLAALLEKVDQQEANMETRMNRLVAKLDDQEAQLKLLAGQAARIDAISQKQAETERGVSDIQADLRSVKTTVDERLTKVEGSLSGIDRRWKAELVEREERLRQDLREELHRDLDTAVASRGFEETLGSRTDTRPQAGQRQQQRPASFDGKMPWEAYQAQFELLADLNSWSHEEKAAHLAMSLKGVAATACSQISLRRDGGATMPLPAPPVHDLGLLTRQNCTGCS